MSENHPAWKHYFDNQRNWGAKSPYEESINKYITNRRSESLDNQIGKHAHELGMIKDLLIVIMNLLEKQGQLIEEQADMLDLLIAGVDDD